MKPAQGEEEKTVPLAQLDSCRFNVTVPKDAPATQTEVWAADGSLISGKLLEVAGDHLKLQTNFARDPMNCQTDGMLRLNLDEPLPPNTPEETPLNRMDRLVWATTTLHGAWTTTGDAALHWLPVGGTQPAAISSGRNVEITRAMPADAKSEPTALFHLKTGDVLPGSLTAVDTENVGIEAPILGIKQIPSKLLRAIQFPSTVEAKGFRDGAWHVIRGGEKDVVRSEDKVTLRPGTSFGHPLMLQSDEVRFSVIGEQRSFTSLRIRLFGNGDDNKTGETRLIIAHYSNRIYAGLEQNDGEFANRCQVNIASESAAAIKLVPHAKDVELFINGTSMLRVPSDSLKRKGVGLVFEPCNLWGNGEYPVVISDFSAQSNPGRSWLPNVDAAARNQALLIPRFRKDAPPRHFLVASNGDLLLRRVVGWHVIAFCLSGRFGHLSNPA